MKPPVQKKAEGEKILKANTVEYCKGCCPQCQYALNHCIMCPKRGYKTKTGASKITNTKLNRDITAVEGVSEQKHLTGDDDFIPKKDEIAADIRSIGDTIGEWKHGRPALAFEVEDRVHKLITKQKEEIVKYVRDEVIGKDLRHITDSKDIDNIVSENEGNVTWDEVANSVQKDIDAQNQLRAEQRQKLDKLLK